MRLASDGELIYIYPELNVSLVEHTKCVLRTVDQIVHYKEINNNKFGCIRHQVL